MTQWQSNDPSAKKNIDEKQSASNDYPNNNSAPGQQQPLSTISNSGAYGHIPPPGVVSSPSIGHIPTRLGHQPSMHPSSNQNPQYSYLPGNYGVNEQQLDQNQAHMEPIHQQGQPQIQQQPLQAPIASQQPYPYQLPQMPAPEFNQMHNLPPQEQWDQFNPMQGYPQQPYPMQQQGQQGQQGQQIPQQPMQPQLIPQNQLPIANGTDASQTSGQSQIRHSSAGGFNGGKSPINSKKSARVRKPSMSSESGSSSSGQSGFKPVTKRSRMGCLTCRQRKKRCCETRPKCTECNRLGLTCIWPKPGTEHKNKPKDVKNEENMIDHQIYGKIKVLRGIVEYKSK